MPTLSALISGLIFILATVTMNGQPGRVSVNGGISIAYESFGKDRNGTVILIQGTGATLLHYPGELCERIASEGYRVIRFDNRDIGLSTHLDSLGQPDWQAIVPLIGTCKPAPLPYTLQDMADDVIGLMDALKIEQAHIAGASMGGAIAQLMAIHYPDRILTLTCMASSTGNPARPQGNPQALTAMATPPPNTINADSLVTYLTRVYRALGSVDDDAVLRERALNHVLYRNWDPASVNRQSAAVMIGDYCDRREQLSKLDLPVLVIHGGDDPIVPVEAGRELARSIPGAKWLMIPEMGHDISVDFVIEIADGILSLAQRNRP